MTPLGGASRRRRPGRAVPRRADAAPALPAAGSRRIRSVDIRDRPRFAWRGAMLDVARHFRSVRDVERYIDLMALYKLNLLHLHLSDDQGWRIAIAKWPRLATHGGTDAGRRRQGRLLHAGAVRGHRPLRGRSGTSRSCPRSTCPGHVNAALSSYPKLACDGEAVAALHRDRRRVQLALHRARRSRTTSSPTWSASSHALTPGPWIHIGGDEAMATKPAEYVRFIGRVQAIVESYGKRMIGWEEIGRREAAPRDDRPALEHRPGEVGRCPRGRRSRARR